VKSNKFGYGGWYRFDSSDGINIISGSIIWSLFILELFEAET